MIKCKICGHAVKYRLIEHIQKTHLMDIDDYKKKHGEYISDEYKQKVSNKAKEVWIRDGYKEKITDIKKSAWTSEMKKSQSKIIKNAYDNGFECWNKGLTKADDIRLVQIGEKNREHLLGRTKHTHAYLKSSSEKMKKFWYSDKNSYKMKLFQKEWMSDVEYENWRIKLSKTICEKHLNGELNSGFSKIKTGYYNGKFYHSGWELEFMKFLDSTNLKWEKDFDVVEYIDESGKIRNYIPDFKVEFEDGDVIIELKGYVRPSMMERVELKKQAGIKKYNNYNFCESVQYAKNIINEKIKSKKYK